MDAFITMYSMELLRQQEITDTNMHMEAVMVTEANTVMETMGMDMVTVTAMAMAMVMEAERKRVMKIKHRNQKQNGR